MTISIIMELMLNQWLDLKKMRYLFIFTCLMLEHLDVSHSEGYNTIATGSYQHVKVNEEIVKKIICSIIGNGHSKG